MHKLQCIKYLTVLYHIVNLGHPSIRFYFLSVLPIRYASTLGLKQDQVIFWSELNNPRERGGNAKSHPYTIYSAILFESSGPPDKEYVVHFTFTPVEILKILLLLSPATKSFNAL